jgi:hypothetical protein
MEPMQLRDLAHKHGLDVIDFYVLMDFVKEIEELEREACTAIVEHKKEIWDTPIYVRERLDTVAKAIRARGLK